MTSKILLTCGANGNGQLGIGRSDVALLPEYVQVIFPAGEDLKHACCGSYHTLAVMRSGKVYAWGMNKNGQLGHTPETVVTQSSPMRLRIPVSGKAAAQHVTRDGDMKIVQAAAGESHTVLLSASGEVYTLGSNAVGQLGRVTGQDTFSFVPTPVDFSSTTAAALHGHLSICSVFAGPNTTFAITPAGHLFGWGGSSSSELGFQQGIVPLPKSITLPSSIHHSYKVVKVAAGCGHTLLLTSTGEVFVSGDNSEGQLGVQGENVSTWRAVRHAKNLRDISTGAQQSFFLTAVGILSECGTNDFANPGSPGQGHSVMEGIGSMHGGSSLNRPPSMVAGTGVGAGNASSHQSSALASVPDLVYDMREAECHGVASGGSSVVAWSEQRGEIYVRGRNHRGQLGLGHISSVLGAFVKVDLSKKILQSMSKEARPPIKLGKLHKVCMGRAHAIAIFSVNVGDDSAEGGSTSQRSTSTPQTGVLDGSSNGSSGVHHAMGEIFVSADDLEGDQQQDLTSSFSDESFRRSCVDDLMSISFSGNKAPTLSFAAANKAGGGFGASVSTVGSLAPSNQTPTKRGDGNAADAPSPVAAQQQEMGPLSRVAIFGVVMTAVALAVVAATKKRQ